MTQGGLTFEDFKEAASLCTHKKHRWAKSGHSGGISGSFEALRRAPELEAG